MTAKPEKDRRSAQSEKKTSKFHPRWWCGALALQTQKRCVEEHFEFNP